MQVICVREPRASIVQTVPNRYTPQLIQSCRYSRPAPSNMARTLLPRAGPSKGTFLADTPSSGAGVTQAVCAGVPAKPPTSSAQSSPIPGRTGPEPLPTAWRQSYELCVDSPVLGNGAFAEVFKVQHRQTQKCFAVKVMSRPNFASRGIEKQIDSEVTTMLNAARAAKEEQMENHVVRLFDAKEEGDHVYLLLELCEHGDLQRLMRLQPSRRFPENSVAVWAKQLLIGLRSVHELGVIHRDIKPDNLLCTEDDLLKIADFGWCAEACQAPTSLAGTFQYMAPEVLQNQPQTEKVDVWSCGVVLFELLVGRQLLTTYLGPGATGLTNQDPYGSAAVKQAKLMEEISATCPPTHDSRPSDLSYSCWDFLRCFLMPDASSRITVEAALQHPWLSSTALQTSTSMCEDVDACSRSMEAASAASLEASFAEDLAPLMKPSGIGGSRPNFAKVLEKDPRGGLPELLAQVPTPMRGRAMGHQFGNTVRCAASQEQFQQPHMPGQPSPPPPCEASSAYRRKSTPYLCQAPVQLTSPGCSLTSPALSEISLSRRVSLHCSQRHMAPPGAFRAPLGSPTLRMPSQADMNGCAQQGVRDLGQESLLQEITNQKHRLVDVLNEFQGQDHSSGQKTLGGAVRRTKSVPPKSEMSQLDTSCSGGSVLVAAGSMTADAFERSLDSSGMMTPIVWAMGDTPTFGRDALSCTAISFSQRAQGEEGNTSIIRPRPSRKSMGELNCSTVNANVPTSPPPVLANARTPRGITAMEAKSVVRRVTLPQYVGHSTPIRIHPPRHVDLPPSAVVVSGPPQPNVHISRTPLVMIRR